MSPIRAVYEDDLLKFLTNIGILSDIRAGRMPCKFCGDPVSLNTLHAVFPESGTIFTVCSKSSCIMELNAHVDSP